MGYDIFGKNPKSGTGKSFKRNISGWEPIADLLLELMPDLAKQCVSWHVNDGQGLDSKQASDLAQALEAAINDGTLGQYMALREEKLDSLPKEVCDVCNGTGAGSNAIDYFALSKKDEEQAQDTGTAEGQCRYCAGKGWTRSKPSLTLEEVKKWIAFLEDCGGFEIW